MLVRPAFATSAPVILIVGDSLSAAYGIDIRDGWVNLLAQRLVKEGYPHRVVNASISGETTGGGRRRLPELLSTHQPRIVVIELGANDGLRGIPLQEVAANFAAMRDAVRSIAVDTVVVRMALPPNYGPDYTQGFNAIYDDLADEKNAVFVTPFFLADIALNPDLLQNDGLHPTAAAQPRMLEMVWPTIAARVRETP
jgi:acyl-CoA thioesterase I